LCLRLIDVFKAHGLVIKKKVEEEHLAGVGHWRNSSSA